MLKLISLHGTFSGSAAVENSGEKLKIKLKLRGRNIPEHITVYLIGGSVIVRAPVINGEGSAKAVDFRGLLAADESGNFIAEGSIGMTPPQMDRAKASVRMMQSPRRREDTGSSGRQAGAYGAEHPNKEETLKNSRPLQGRDFRQPSRADTSAHSASKSAPLRHDNTQSGKTGRCSEAAKQTRAPSKNANRRSNTRPPARQSVWPPAAGNGSGPSRQNMAQVTGEILDTARRLFNTRDNMASAFCPPGPRGEKEPSGMPSVSPVSPVSPESFPGAAFMSSSGNRAQDAGQVIENPFPQLFPNSEWRSFSGRSSSLKGRANVKGVLYDITALRSSNRRYPPAGLSGNIRRIFSKDGKLYWIGITLRK